MATPSRNPIRLSDEDKQELAESSQQAKENAHCPYSKFRVGSAVLVRFKNGEKKIFKGCNVENCAYPLCTCAERVAITKAVSEGFSKDGELLAIAVTSDMQDDFCVPCGGCRQVIAEFGYSNNCLVLLVKPSGERRETTIRDLLPDAFTPEALN